MHRRLNRAVVLAAASACWLSWASAATSPAPSFDCTKASRPVDKLICSNADLAGADAALARIYKAALEASATDVDRAELRDAQRAWLAMRDAQCLGRTGTKSQVDCLKDMYSQRIAALAGGSKAVSQRPGVMTMDDSSLTAAHPKVRSQMGFPQGAFSPSGRLFAFSVDNIISGDTDQIWIYDLANRRLAAATPLPAGAKPSVTIDNFFWVGDALYVKGSNGEEGGAQTPFKREATLTGSHDVPSLPTQPALPGGARDTTDAAGDELADQGDKRVEDAHYAVTAKNVGGGAITLSARAKSGGREWTIATGDWDLSPFVFDAPRAHVLYGDSTKGITVYDLKSRAAVATVPVALDGLLDVSGDGHLAAYVALGACDAAPGASPGPKKSLCFVKLP